MRYVLALFLPWLAFFTMGMVLSGIVCLILQLTVIGWLPATIWAFFAINNYYSERRNDELIHAIDRNRRSSPTRG